MRRRTRRRRRGRVLAYSSLVTFTALAAAFSALLYLSSQPIVEHLPQNIPLETREWMQPIPPGAEYIAFINYTGMLEGAQQPLLNQDRVLLDVYQLNTRISVGDVEYSVAVAIPNPGRNSSEVYILKPKPEVTASVEQVLNQSKIVGRWNYSGSTLYYVLSRRTQPTLTYVGAYLSIANGLVIFSQGTGEDLLYCRKAVEKVLDTLNASTSLFSGRPDIRASVFAATRESPYFAIFIADFPTQVAKANVTLKSIAYHEGKLLVRRVFMFPSLAVGIEQLEEVRQIYRGGTDYRFLDNYLVATFTLPIDQLRNEIIGL